MKGLLKEDAFEQTVLYATYVSPFPANSGERIRALNLIAALRQHGYRVEALVGNYNGADLASQDALGLRFQEIPFAWPRLRQSASVYFWPHRRFVQQVLALHRSRPLSAIILDYGFIGAQIKPFEGLGIPIVLGTHNVESVLTGQAPKSSMGARLALKLRQAVEAAHERKFFSRADALICVSEEDRRAYAGFIPADRVHLVPNFTDIPDTYEHALRAERIIMSGSFDNFQNREGFRWFMNNVWDKEMSGQMQFCIAGRHSDGAAEEFRHVPGLVGMGPRQDLLAEIAQSRCAIVPLLQGGGTRLKCLEAMAVRTPVVTTSKGCEGIEHHGTFWVADSPQRFKAAILEVFADKQRAAKRAAEARAIFDRSFSLAANAAHLDGVLSAARRQSQRRLRD